MAFSLLLILFLTAGPSLAFPSLANEHGIDTSLLMEHDLNKRQSSCPFNSNHQGAAPITSQYPYSGAKFPLPGTGIGGYQVPAPGDTAHYYTPPGPNDIRGPCPGLNALANHNFISHDGITTLAELTDAQQHVFNLDYDFAITLAVLGVTVDGDVTTGKLSIGCDATSRTAPFGIALGQETGLNTHNKFEGDTSLTRDDFFTGGGDDYSFNGTLFAMMDKTCNSLFDYNGLSVFKNQRYNQSLQENPNFFYGPIAFVLFAAAVFLYRLFPNYGPDGTPDLATTSSWFGASQAPDGTWTHVPERIPDNWHNRHTPLGFAETDIDIVRQYTTYPVLLGGNTAAGTFDAINFQSIQQGKVPLDPQIVLCLWYQIIVDGVPVSLSDVIQLPLQVLEFALTNLNPIFQGYGCPIKTL